MTSALFRRAVPLLAVLALLAMPVAASASEANLKLPDLNSSTFLGGIGGKTLLFSGLAVSAIGMLFGLMMYSQLKNLPVHKSMLEVSELIYETCKTYLITQGKFLFVLWLFIGSVIAIYFGTLAEYGKDADGNPMHGFPPERLPE